MPGSLKPFARFDAHQLNPLLLPYTDLKARLQSLRFPTESRRSKWHASTSWVNWWLWWELFVLGAGFVLQDSGGYYSLQAFSAAQNVVLKYNEQAARSWKTWSSPKIMPFFLGLSLSGGRIRIGSEWSAGQYCLWVHVPDGSDWLPRATWQPRSCPDKKQEYKVKSIQQDLMRFPWMGITGMVLIGCIRWMERFARWHGVGIFDTITELGVGTVTASAFNSFGCSSFDGLLGRFIDFVGGWTGANCSVEFAPKPVHLNQECSRQMEVLPWLLKASRFKLSSGSASDVLIGTAFTERRGREDRESNLDLF